MTGILEYNYTGVIRYILQILCETSTYLFTWPAYHIRLYNENLKEKDIKTIGPICRFIKPNNPDSVRPNGQVEVFMLFWVILTIIFVVSSHDEYIYGSSSELVMQKTPSSAPWHAIWVKEPLNSLQSILFHTSGAAARDTSAQDTVGDARHKREHSEVASVLGVDAEAYFPMHIAFQNVGCELQIPNSISGDFEYRNALHGVTGAIQPGRITGILGPSGSGKSTLAAAILGRTKKLCYRSTGQVYLNGSPRTLEAFMDRLSYVPQHETLHAELTVEETLLFNARLRLPLAFTEQQRLQLVNQTIHMMGLDEVRSSRVGSVLRRGLSGGERKRLGIAKELIARPSVLVLDEPTTGLDSAAAYQLMQALSYVATSGVSVVAILHHPSARMFRLLDDVILLQESTAVFVGPRAHLVPFFHELGFGRVDQSGLGAWSTRVTKKMSGDFHENKLHDDKSNLECNVHARAGTQTGCSVPVSNQLKSESLNSKQSDTEQVCTNIPQPPPTKHNVLPQTAATMEHNVLPQTTATTEHIVLPQTTATEHSIHPTTTEQKHKCSSMHEKHNNPVSKNEIVMSTAEHIMDILAGDVDYPDHISNPRLLFQLGRHAKKCSEVIVQNIDGGRNRMHEVDGSVRVVKDILLSSNEVLDGSEIAQTWLMWVYRLSEKYLQPLLHRTTGSNEINSPTQDESEETNAEELTQCLKVVEAHLHERNKPTLADVWHNHSLAKQNWKDIESHMTVMRKWETDVTKVACDDPMVEKQPNKNDVTNVPSVSHCHLLKNGKSMLDSCNSMTNTLERSFCLIQYGMRSKVPFRRTRPGSLSQILLWFYNDLSISWRKGVLAHLVSTILLAGVAGFVRSYNNAWSQRSLSNMIISLALSLLGSVGAIFEPDGYFVTRAVSAGILMGTHHWSGVLLCMVRGYVIAHVFAVTFHFVVYVRTGISIISSRDHYLAMVYILFLNYMVSNATGYLIKEVTVHNFASANILAVANLIGCHVFAYYSPNRNQVDNASKILGSYDMAWMVHWCCTCSYARYFLELLTLWESRDADRVGRSFVLGYFGYKQENKSVCQSIIWGMTWWIQWVRALTFAVINLTDLTLLYEVPVFLKYLAKVWFANFVVLAIVVLYAERNVIVQIAKGKHDV